MIIESIHVKNFRSIKDEILSLKDLTILVGTNGAGKSAFLRAFDLFFNDKLKVEISDFYNKETAKEIGISITFTDLSDGAKEKFKKYLRRNKLTIERIYKFEDTGVVGSRHGSSLQNPDFLKVKTAGNAAEVRREYNLLKEKSEYSILPNYRSKDQAIAELINFEENNSDKCKYIRDDGQFFGYKSVGYGYITDFIEFIFIPAVRDASKDAEDGKGSPINELLDLVVRSVISNKEDIIKFKEDTRQDYKEKMKLEKNELSGLENGMTKTLMTFIKNSSVKLNWADLGELTIPDPKAEVKLTEDGYECEVNRVGHGLQRVFIITLLQHLLIEKKKAANTKEDEVKELCKNLILTIEEPELYQHPNRLRHLSRVLFELAQGKIPGIIDNTQILFCTHSPLFVGFDRIDNIRMLRKNIDNNDPQKPKITNTVSTNLNKVAKIIWEANGKPGQEYTGDSLRPRLKTLFTPWLNEGFFAKVVVLVEGENDRAALLGVANSINIDMESKDIAIIPCNGKTNLDKAFVVFSQLGIPVYVIWDSDKNKKNSKPEQNHYLQRLVGCEKVEDWPRGVYSNYACFEDNLDITLKKEISEDKFCELLELIKDKFSITEDDHALKNPFVISDILKEAKKNKMKCITIEKIIQKIVNLKD